MCCQQDKTIIYYLLFQYTNSGNIFMRDSESQCNHNVLKPASKDLSYHESSSRQLQKKGRKKKGNIVLKPRVLNIYTPVHRFLNPSHICNMFDHFCINQESIRNQNQDESILKTAFFTKHIVRVEREGPLVYIFCKSSNIHSDIPYFIERFNSFGDEFYHQVAVAMRQIFDQYQMYRLRANQLRNRDLRECERQKKQKLTTVIKGLRGRAFFIKEFPDNYLISNEFLETLGIDQDQFCRQSSFYRAILTDFFPCQNYRFWLQGGLSLLSKLFEIRNEVVNIEHLLRSSIQIHDTSIVGVNQKKIRVQVKGSMPSPEIICVQILKVYGETYAFQYKAQKLNLLKQAFQEEIKKVQLERELFKDSRYDNTDDYRCSYKPKPKIRRKKQDLDYNC